jgi:hypothetical protein
MHIRTLETRGVRITAISHMGGVQMILHALCC